MSKLRNEINGDPEGFGYLGIPFPVRVGEMEAI